MGIKSKSPSLSEKLNISESTVLRNVSHATIIEEVGIPLWKVT